MSIEQFAKNAPILTRDKRGIVLTDGRHVSPPRAQWSVKEPAPALDDGNQTQF
jgi:hypothetical protein